VLGLLFLVTGALIEEPLLKRFVRLDAQGSPIDMSGLMAFLAIGFGILLAIVLLWVRWVERRSVASIGLAGPDKLRRFLHGHLIGALSILAIVVVMWLVGALALTTTVAPAAATNAWTSAQALLWIFLLLLGFAFQASVEEILFRGWLLSVLAKKFNVFLAVLLSSGLFTLAHLSPDQRWLVTVSNFLFAVFCCSWVLRTRNLFGVMGWHAGWNWLLAVGFGLPVTGIDVGIPALLVDLTPAGTDWLTGGSEGPEGSVVCIAYFVTTTLFMWLSPKREPAPVAQ
jgi:membrane protease YdiL (CAAX protease family)